MIFLLYHNADIFVDYLLKVIFYRCYPLILVFSGKIKSGGIYVIEQRFFYCRPALPGWGPNMGFTGFILFISLMKSTQWLISHLQMALHG